MQKLGIGLGILIGVALAIWVWQPDPTVCERTLAYRIGEIDKRFGLSTVELRETVQQAEALWEAESGTNLFEYDPTARLTINLVFDARQHITIAKQHLASKLKLTEASHTQLTQSYDHWRSRYDAQIQTYETALSAYQERLRMYNEEADYWNKNGGAPKNEYERLESERATLSHIKQALDEERQSLQDVIDTMKSLQDQETRLVALYQRQAKTYQSLYGETTHFHKGEYNGSAITIYQFHDTADLTLVLAHELGHALGLRHVDDPQAVMHAFMGEQDITHLRLSRDDIAMLGAACKWHADG